MIKKPLPILLTQEGFDKAKSDHDALQIKREEVLVRLQAAREMGDLSENGAYTSAKFELGTIDRELRRISHLLKYGVVTKHNMKSQVVEFGSEVSLERDGNIMRFRLVSNYESDPAMKKLSKESPFGRAVLGKQKGEKITVEAPAGKTVWKIVSID